MDIPRKIAPVLRKGAIVPLHPLDLSLISIIISSLKSFLLFLLMNHFVRFQYSEVAD